jgi:hypothetical protein
MAVIKLTSSKKALMFIDDDGNNFITSVTAVSKCMTDSNPNNFVVLSRLPHSTAPNRFPKSPVYEPLGDNPKVKDTSNTDKLTTATDVFSKQVKVDKEIKDVML